MVIQWTLLIEYLKHVFAFRSLTFRSQLDCIGRQFNAALLAIVLHFDNSVDHLEYVLIVLFGIAVLDNHLLLSAKVFPSDIKNRLNPFTKIQPFRLFVFYYQNIFYGESAKAIKIQVWVTLIANLLLMVVLKRVRNRYRSFSRLLQ